MEICLWYFCENHPKFLCTFSCSVIAKFTFPNVKRFESTLNNHICVFGIPHSWSPRMCVKNFGMLSGPLIGHRQRSQKTDFQPCSEWLMWFLIYYQTLIITLSNWFLCFAKIVLIHRVLLYFILQSPIIDFVISILSSSRVWTLLGNKFLYLVVLMSPPLSD